jgi:hypothetical protein
MGRRRVADRAFGRVVAHRRRGKVSTGFAGTGEWDWCEPLRKYEEDTSDANSEEVLAVKEVTRSMYSLCRVTSRGGR